MQRTLIASTCAALLAALAPGARADEEVVLRFAKTFLPGTKDFKAIKHAAEKIRAVTEGRVRIEWVEVDLETDLVGDLIEGRLAMAAVPTMALSDRIPGLLPLGLPALLRNRDEVEWLSRTFRGEVERRIGSAGLESLAHIDRGFTYLMSVGAVRTPEDLNGVRLWLPEGASFERLSDALSIPSVRAPMGDVARHLERSRAGDETSANAILAWPQMAILQGWHAHLTHVLDVPMFPVDLRLVAGRDALSGVSEGDRAVLRDELRRAFQELLENGRRGEADWPRLFEREEIEFVRPDEAGRAAWWAWGRRIQDAAVEGHAEDLEMLRRIRESLDARRESP